jgi:AcrR family transcriptional regulator
MPGQKAAEAERREQILKAAYDVAVRRGIDGLTVRAVAARARLSHGLVLFHFKRKDQLGLALLDRVLATTISLRMPEQVSATPDPWERLLALCQHEIHRLSEEPRQTRLFLEYWARGAHNAVIRARISAGLESYRGAFRTIAEEAVPQRASSRPSGSPAGVAAATVSLILGCPVQAMIDPEHFDVREYSTVVRGILNQLAMAA